MWRQLRTIDQTKRAMVVPDEEDMTMARRIDKSGALVNTVGSDDVAALRLVQSSRLITALARLLLVGLVLAIAAMLLLPWQQSARGTGQVAAFIPQERQQTVMSPTKGLVERVAEGIVERLPRYLLRELKGVDA